jgi:4-hydroxy-2-oxoheptanedioate aldolase
VIIRVPSADPTTLKLVMDRGFRSIMAPMINTAAEAKAFADACRYPPFGRRGYAAPIVRASGWGTETGYTQGAHEELLLIAQIEHVDAIDEIEAIAAVEGIDALLIGPNDLAGSMGLLERLEDKKVRDACERVETAALAAGKWLGSIPRPGRTAQELHDIGCRLIAGPADIMLFLDGARAAVDAFAIDTTPPAPRKAKPSRAATRSASGAKSSGAASSSGAATSVTKGGAAAKPSTVRSSASKTAAPKAPPKAKATKTAGARTSANGSGRTRRPTKKQD